MNSLVKIAKERYCLRKKEIGLSGSEIPTKLHFRRMKEKTKKVSKLFLFENVLLLIGRHILDYYMLIIGKLNNLSLRSLNWSLG